MDKIVLLGQALTDYICLYNPLILRQEGIILPGSYKREISAIDAAVRQSEVLHTDIGGCVTNTAIGIHKLGATCILYNVVASDERGITFTQEISKFRGIENKVTIMEGDTGEVLTFIELPDKNTPHYGLYNQGVANRLCLNNSIKDQVHNAILYFSLFSLFDADSSGIFDILKYAKGVGARLLFDGGGSTKVAEEKLTETLPLCNGILLNEFEFARLRSSSKLERMTFDVPWIVVKRGIVDSEFYENGRPVFSVPVEEFKEAINCLGAGDAFAAAFLVSLQKNEGFYRAVLNGHNYAKKIVCSIATH